MADRQPHSRLVLVLDFDGTVTERDIGDEICDRFAPPAWREIDAAWERGELALPEAQRRMWALARCERSAAMAYAHQVGVRRPGLRRLLDAVARRGEAWLASGGFDFYIEALLDGELGAFARAWFNRARFENGCIAVEFPHDELACARCAVCKGRACDLARATGAQVVFVGDGASDRCAIGRADRIFAVRDSKLARACEQAGSPYLPFSDLGEIADQL